MYKEEIIDGIEKWGTIVKELEEVYTKAELKCEFCHARQIGIGCPLVPICGACKIRRMDDRPTTYFKFLKGMQEVIQLADNIKDYIRDLKNEEA